MAGAAPWRSRGRPTAARLLVEFGGRACYRSWEPGLNANVTKVRTDQREYFANILRSAHGTVLEHANYSFALRNVAASSRTSSSATAPGRPSARRACATCA